MCKREERADAYIDTVVAKSTGEITGGMGTVSDHLRVFSFRKETGFICIDFTWYRVVPGWLYVVPAGHRIYLPQGLRPGCVCRKLNPGSLPEEVQKRLFLLQFSEQKAVAPSDVIAELLADQKTHPGPSVDSNPFPEDRYRKIASAFCEKVREIPLSQMTATTDLAALLNTCERTVRRACLETYGVTPAIILRYHLTLIAVELLTDSEAKMRDVSGRLGFSDYSKCSRFLKGRMGMSPNVFRQQIRAL